MRVWHCVLVFVRPPVYVCVSESVRLYVLFVCVCVVFLLRVHCCTSVSWQIHCVCVCVSVAVLVQAGVGLERPMRAAEEDGGGVHTPIAKRPRHRSAGVYVFV